MIAKSLAFNVNTKTSGYKKEQQKKKQFETQKGYPLFPNRLWGQFFLAIHLDGQHGCLGNEGS